MPSTTREVALHEGAHTAALALAGLPPLTCRIDEPSRDTAGAVRIDWDRADPGDRAHLRAVLIAVLAGPITDNEPCLHDWPIEPGDWQTGNRRDAEQARHLAIDRLKIDNHVDWLQIVCAAERLERTPTFRTLTIRIADELVEKDLLVQPEILKIVTDVHHKHDDQTPS